MDENFPNPNDSNPPGLIDQYLRDLQNPDPSVRLSAIKALEGSGSREQRVINALIKLSEDEKGTENGWMARLAYTRLAWKTPGAPVAAAAPTRRAYTGQIEVLNYSSGDLIGETISTFFGVRSLWGVILLLTVISGVVIYIGFSALLNVTDAASVYCLLGLFYLFLGATYGVITGATAHLVVQHITHAEEKLGSAVKAGVKWLLPQLGMSLLIWIPGGILIAILALLFSGDYRAVYYVLSIPISFIFSGTYLFGTRALMVDQLSVVDSITAGWNLFKRKWLSFLGLSIVMGLIVSVALVPGYCLLGLIIRDSGYRLLTNPLSSIALFYLLITFVALAVSAFMNVFWTLAYMSWRTHPETTPAPAMPTQGFPMQPVS